MTVPGNVHKISILRKRSNNLKQAICSLQLRNQTVYEMKCKTVLEKRRIASKWAIEAGL